VTPIEEEDGPLSRLELPEDQQNFLVNYETLVAMLPWEPGSDEYHTFNDLLSAMLSQANTWGQEKARGERE
jgi:hypothetical protein